MQRQPCDFYIRKIEFVFYNENEIRQTIADEYNIGLDFSTIKNGSKIADPTASLAIKNLSILEKIKIKGKELEKPFSWLALIDKTYFWCKHKSNIYYKVARARYKGLDYRQICRAVSIAQSTMSKIMKEIRQYAKMQAIQMRLVWID